MECVYCGRKMRKGKFCPDCAEHVGDPVDIDLRGDLVPRPWWATSYGERQKSDKAWNRLISLIDKMQETSR